MVRPLRIGENYGTPPRKLLPVERTHHVAARRVFRAPSRRSTRRTAHLTLVERRMREVNEWLLSHS